MIKNFYRKVSHKVNNLIDFKEVNEVKKIVENQQPIYHIHIRKTGGTTINFAFLANTDVADVNEFYLNLARKKNHRIVNNSKVFVGWNLILLNQGNYSFGFSHRPLHELNLADKIFKFTCLRDPVKRVVSHYKMLKYFQLNNIEDPSLKIEGKWLGNSIIDFVSNAPKSAIFNQLYMFSNRFDIDEAADKLSSLDAVIFTEQLEEGLKRLESLTDWKLPVSNQKKFKNNLQIEEEHLVRLKEILDDEYLLLNKVKQHLSTKDFSAKAH